MIRHLVERVYGGRRFAFGPATAEYTSTVMVSTGVQWEQIGAGLRWDSDETSIHLDVSVGPFDTRVCIGRNPEAPKSVTERPVEKAFRIGGRDLVVYLMRRHIGATAGWGRSDVHGLIGRVDIGPLGVALIPARR